MDWIYIFFCCSRVSVDIFVEHSPTVRRARPMDSVLLWKCLFRQTKNIIKKISIKSRKWILPLKCSPENAPAQEREITSAESHKVWLLNCSEVALLSLAEANQEFVFCVVNVYGKEESETFSRLRCSRERKVTSKKAQKEKKPIGNIYCKCRHEISMFDQQKYIMQNSILFRSAVVCTPVKSIWIQAENLQGDRMRSDSKSSKPVKSSKRRMHRNCKFKQKSVIPSRHTLAVFELIVSIDDLSRVVIMSWVLISSCLSASSQLTAFPDIYRVSKSCKKKCKWITRNCTSVCISCSSNAVAHTKEEELGNYFK